MSEWRKRAVLGTEIAVVDYARVLARIDEMGTAGERGYLCHVPVHSLMLAREEPAFAAALLGSEASLPDGMPVVWALRLLGEEIGDRVYGPALMERWFGQGEGRRAWLYGGHDPPALAQLVVALEDRFPGVQIAGAHSPPHREPTPEEEATIVEQINADRPDVVWAGIGAPRQELWMQRVRPALEAPVLVGVGAAFDFLAGRVSQAPAWMQSRGLEWLWRLGREPRRLAPRYLRDNPRFVGAIARQWARERRRAR